MNARLDQFIRDALLKGVARPQIEQALLESGWKTSEVTEALASYSEEPFPIPVPSRSVYTYAHEAYKHLVMYFVLYISMFSFGALLFDYIDIGYPDPLAGSMVSVDGIRQSTATLLVAFPLYIILHYSLWSSMRKSEEKRQSKVRLWLTYLTMFLAACTFIGELIGIVFSRLAGTQFTTRIILQLLVVMGIACTVLGYYLVTLRRDEKSDSNSILTKSLGQKKVSAVAPVAARAFFTVVILAFVIVVGFGMYYSSNPSKLQSKKNEVLILTRIQSLVTYVNRYWSANGQLPTGLISIQADPSFSGNTEDFTDPNSNSLFTYQVLQTDQFELCTTFADASSSTDPMVGRLPQVQHSDPAAKIVWDHPAGLNCFPFLETAPVNPPTGTATSTPSLEGKDPLKIAPVGKPDPSLTK